MKKRLLALVLSITMLLGMGTPVKAGEKPEEKEYEIKVVQPEYDVMSATVTVNGQEKNTAKEGDMVTVRMEANEGYEVRSVWVDVENGRWIGNTPKPSPELPAKVATLVFNMQPQMVLVEPEIGRAPGFPNRHNVTIATTLKDGEWEIPLGTDIASLVKGCTCDEGCELSGELDIKVWEGDEVVANISQVGYATLDFNYLHNDHLISHRGRFFRNIYVYDPADRVDHKINLIRPENGYTRTTVNSGNSGRPENVARRGDEVVIWAGHDKGYKVEEVKIVDTQGNIVPIEYTKPMVDPIDNIIRGTMTVLNMPGSDITVTAKISKLPGSPDVAPEAPPINPDSEVPQVSYPDVKADDWFYEAVNYVTSNQIMTGYTGGGFGPADLIGRGQFATMLYRTEGSPVTIFEGVFPDVPSGEFYSLPVIWANKNGVITGYGDGRFGVSDSMTREQIATMMYRYAKGKGWDVGVKASIDGFPDAGNVTTFAREAISWAVGMGIISGDQGKLNPQGESSRAVTATIIQRFHEKY